MKPDRWQQIKSAFGEVLQLEPGRRRAFIKDIGATDPDLGRRVASLLLAHEQDGDDFLRDPAVDLDIYQDLIEDDANAWVGRSIGPFRLLRSLGAGGMGEVYLAEREDAQFDQRVAIKLIRSGHESAAVVSRFKAERQILAGLDHPNIARLLDGGRTSEGRPYFVMEYVPGLPVTQYCEQKGSSIRDRLELVIQACGAVQHAHQNAIIHRDLKPSNMLVVEVDGRALCRIIDFGLAKTTASLSGAEPQLTRLGLFMGTPGYISPEQADVTTQNVDTRTDVYSLGAILYRLLTGLHPFESVDRQLPPFDQWLRQLREQAPVRPSSVARTVADKPVSADLDWIVLKALERDRDRRYSTPADLAADLRRFLRHEPVLARPPSTLYQLGKLVRRHRVAAGAVVVAAFALASGLSTAVWQAHVAGAEAREARAQEQAARAQAVKVRQLGALSAEQAGDAASQLGLVSAAVARLAYAVRLDPTNPTLRSHLLQLLDEQDVWWLPRGPGFRHPKVQMVQFSADAGRIATGSEDGTVIIWDLHTGRQSGATIRHQGAIFALNFSPDGKRLVTGSADHTARVWDAFTGEPLSSPLVHGGEVNDASFSPDGERLVTGSGDGRGRVWDWRSGRVVGVPARHKASILAVQFSPDGSHFVTASKDHTGRIWDARTGRALSAPLQHGDFAVYAEFNADGTRVLTASVDATTRVWDGRTGRPIGKPMRHSGVVRQAKFSPDGTHVMTWSWDRTVRIWDVRTGDPIGEPLLLPLQVVEGFFSPDGELGFTVQQDGSARAWDMRTGKPRGAAVQLTSAEIVHADFNGRLNLLVTVGRDGGVKLWDVRLGANLRNPLRQDGNFRFIQFSPDGRRVVTNSADHSATVWDPQSGRPLVAPLDSRAEVADARFSNDGRKLVTLSADGVAQIWNPGTGHAIGTPMSHGSAVSVARFSQDGTLLLTSTVNGTVRLWDSSTGQARGAPLFEGDASTQNAGAAFSPDGTRFAAAENDSRSGVGSIRLWDTRTGHPVGLPMVHATAVSDWSFSPDGSRIGTISVASALLAIEGEARTIRLWDTRTTRPLGHPFVYDGQLTPPLLFSPDGRYFVIATLEGSAREWDGFTAAPLERAFAHQAGLTDTRISPDGARVATASMDQTARVWDARSGAQLGSPLRHDGVVWSVRFSADGKRIATASGDRTAQVWDTQTQKPITGPMHHDWPVRFAFLSPDGKFLTTISVARDKRRIWPLLSATPDEAGRLEDFAEAVGGSRVDATGALVPVQNRALSLDRLRTEFRALGGSPTDLSRIFDDLVRVRSEATEGDVPGGHAPGQHPDAR